MIDGIARVEQIPDAPQDARAKAKRVILAHDPKATDILVMLGLGDTK